jgi:hypothetical protein
MPADAPTILATSGGIREGRRTRWEFSPLTEYAIELSGVTGRPPRVCFVATALGDDPATADGILPPGYATDDGAGVLYRGTEFSEAVRECDNASAYFVEDVEHRLDTRRL